MNWKPWAQALLAAFIVGFATVAVSALVGVKDLRALGDVGVVGLIAGLAGGLAYLKQSPLPPGPKILLLLVILLAAGAPIFAQVSLSYTPEPMAVLQALDVRDVGLWVVRACNDGTATVTLPPERIYMAAPPSLRLITPERARAVLLDRRGKSRKAQVVTYIKYGLLGASALTGFGPIAATPTIVTSLGLGAGLAGEVQRQLEADLPSLSPFTDDLLDGPLQLAAGQCLTRSAFAAKVKSPQTVTAQILQR